MKNLGTKFINIKYMILITLICSLSMLNASVVSLTDGSSSYTIDTRFTDANADLIASNINAGFDFLYANIFFLAQVDSNE